MKKILLALAVIALSITPALARKMTKAENEAFVKRMDKRFAGSLPRAGTYGQEENPHWKCVFLGRTPYETSPDGMSWKKYEENADTYRCIDSEKNITCYRQGTAGPMYCVK